MEYQPTNREKARQPRGKSFYCACDRTMVMAGEKCPLCHRRCGKKRDKIFRGFA